MSPPSTQHEISAAIPPLAWSRLPAPRSAVSAWRKQARVIIALAIREMEADYARFELGYLWAVVEPSIYIALLTAVHVFIRGVSPRQLHSMTPMMFIVLGVMPFLAYARTMNSTYRIIFANKHVLQLPGVTTLDLIAAHALLKFATYNCLFLIFGSIAVIMEGTWPPRNLLAVLFYFNSAWALGVSFGMTMIPIHRAFPALEHFMILISRACFWTGGLFFIIIQVPSWAWPYLTWNPVMHITELTRSSWFRVYDTPIGSLSYILSCIFILCLIGIIADRAMRDDPAR